MIPADDALHDSAYPTADLFEHGGKDGVVPEQLEQWRLVCDNSPKQVRTLPGQA